MSRLFELLCGRRTKLHDTVDRALRQMNQAGFAIPISADGRRLLGTVLLFACVRGSESLTGPGGIDIEVNTKQTVQSSLGPQQTDSRSSPSLDLIARSRAGTVVNQCGIRIWRDAAPDIVNHDATEKCNSSAYFLRVYTRTPGIDREQPVADYALLVN
jgi:hypothetical protein